MLVFTSDRSVYACNLEGCMDQEHTLTADSTLESLTVLKLGSRVTNASFSPDGVHPHDMGLVRVARQAVAANEH